MVVTLGAIFHAELLPRPGDGAPAVWRHPSDRGSGVVAKTMPSCVSGLAFARRPGRANGRVSRRRSGSVSSASNDCLSSTLLRR